VILTWLRRRESPRIWWRTVLRLRRHARSASNKLMIDATRKPWRTKFVRRRDLQPVRRV